MEASGTFNIAIQENVKQIVANIRNLPTPPLVFSQIQKVINKENSSANDVAKILSEDPSMAAKVLKMTNSAFYGLQREVDSVKQAVLIIGFEAVKNLVLSASVLEMFKGNRIDSEFQERFWRHSLAAAFGCKLVAKEVKSRGMFAAESAFTAGLLHDIGKLVIACYLKDDFAEIKAALTENPDLSDSEVEQSVLGYTHADIGAALVSNWNLSLQMVDGIACHHYPAKSEADLSLAYPVYLGNYLAKQIFMNDYVNRKIEPIDPKVMAYLDVTDESIAGLVEMLREDYTNAETFVSMAGS